MDKLLEITLEEAREARSTVMRHYQQTLTVQHKPDGSPLTLADHAAHEDHQGVNIFATQNGIGECVGIGSALKYSLLASGDEHVFPRLVGGLVRDKTARQVALEALEGQVLDWHTGNALEYGKPRRRAPRLLAQRVPYS